MQHVCLKVCKLKKVKTGRGKGTGVTGKGYQQETALHLTGNLGKFCISQTNCDSTSLLQPLPKFVSRKYCCFYLSEFGFMWSVPIFFKESRACRGFCLCPVWPSASATPCSGPGFTAEEHLGSWASPCASLSLSFFMCQLQRWEGV